MKEVSQPNKSLESESAGNESKTCLTEAELKLIDRAWKSGQFQNYVQGPANATMLVAKMVKEIRRLRIKCGESRMIMGYLVPWDTCSICGNKAESKEDLCGHLRVNRDQVHPDPLRPLQKVPEDPNV